MTLSPATDILELPVLKEYKALSASVAADMIGASLKELRLSVSHHGLVQLDNWVIGCDPDHDDHFVVTLHGKAKYRKAPIKRNAVIDLIVSELATSSGDLAHFTYQMSTRGTDDVDYNAISTAATKCAILQSLCAILEDVTDEDFTVVCALATLETIADSHRSECIDGLTFDFARDLG